MSTPAKQVMKSVSGEKEGVEKDVQENWTGDGAKSTELGVLRGRVIVTMRGNCYDGCLCLLFLFIRVLLWGARGEREGEVYGLGSNLHTQIVGRSASAMCSNVDRESQALCWKPLVR